MTDFNNIMQRSSQKPLDELTIEEGINFAKDFALLAVKLVNKTEFHEWLKFWFIQQNKEKRDLIRRQNREKTELSMVPVQPLELIDTVIHSQIQKFLKFADELLRQQLTRQFSGWTVPQSFYINTNVY